MCDMNKKILIEESVLRQALNYLETAAFRDSDRDEAITALRSALDAEKVEPVAWLYKDTYGKLKVSQIEEHDEHDFPVFTHPAPTTLVDSLAEKIAIATREIEGWKAVADAGEKIIAARDEQIAELEEKIKQQIRFRGDALRERDEWKREFKAAYKRGTDAEEQLATVTAERDELVEAVLAVCCDPEGRVVIRGSDGDRAVLQAALSKLGADKTGEK